jgi:hypothetical protein
LAPFLAFTSLDCVTHNIINPKRRIQSGVNA